MLRRYGLHILVGGWVLLFALSLAADLFGGAKADAPSPGPSTTPAPPTPSAVEAALADLDAAEPIRRQRAILFLVREGAPQAASAVRRGLTDPSVQVRAAVATYALGELPEAEFPVADVAARLADPEPAVRDAAAAALERLRASAEVLPFVEAYVRSSNPDAARAAIEVARARRFQEPAGAIRIVRAALRHADRRVQEEALAAAASFPPEERASFAAEIDRLARSPDPAVRAAAKLR